MWALLTLNGSFEAISLSYNGGKDCLVLLILYLAVLHTHFSRLQNEDPSTAFPKSIPSIYAKPPDPFPAVSSFVDYSSKLYHLDLTHIPTNPGPKKKERSHSNPPLTQPPPQIEAIQADHELPLKTIVSFRDAFTIYLAKYPHVKAIFVGTRRTDPHGEHLTHFDSTDHNWPTFMRIHPVIDWHLNEIWCFLRSPYLKDIHTGGPLKYCTIYDEGYTSLGGVNDTLKNPKLKYHDEEGNERYRPAYEMTQDDGERLGRE
jgi:FAD synthetase